MAASGLALQRSRVANKVRSIRPHMLAVEHMQPAQAFQQRTGVPVLINTSFNIQGKPIVCAPRDAVEAFYSSPLDALVMGPFLLSKAETPP